MKQGPTQLAPLRGTLEGHCLFVCFLSCFSIANLTTLAATSTPITSKTLGKKASEWEGLFSSISKVFSKGVVEAKGRSLA